VSKVIHIAGGITKMSGRRKVQEKVLTFKKDLSDGLEELSHGLSREIEMRRERLSKRINTWHDIQKMLVPQIGDVVAQQAISGKAAGFPETEVLYVPSDFSEGDRIKYGLISLGENERRLLQGMACDYVSKIRTVSKTIDSGKADKKLQEYGQHSHTRTGDEIRSIERLRQCCINDYSAVRKSMIALGMSPDDPCYPLLTLKDTFWKATYSKRALGNSQRFDGPAWTHTGVTGGSRQIPSTIGSGPIVLPNLGIGTQAVKAKCKMLFFSSHARFLKFPLGTMSSSAEPKQKGKKRCVEEVLPSTGEDDLKGSNSIYPLMITS